MFLKAVFSVILGLAIQELWAQDSRVSVEDSIAIQALPKDVREAYEMLFPAASSTHWIKDGDFFVANSEVKRSKYYFDRFGSLKRIEALSDLSQIPMDLRSEVERKLATFNISKVMKITFEGTEHYGLEISQAQGDRFRVLLNRGGTIISITCLGDHP